MKHCNHQRFDSKSNIEVVCSHCLTVDPGPEAADPESIARVYKQLDFTSDGPPLLTCDLCKKRYKEWEVPLKQWELLPKSYHDSALCEDDFLRLLQENGHDKSKVKITHEKWKAKLKEWKRLKNKPKNYTPIRINDDEVMWCEVYGCQADGTFLVQLLNTSILNEDLTGGSFMLAKWNGSRRHGFSGRPMLEPIRLVASSRKPQSKKTATRRR